MDKNPCAEFAEMLFGPTPVGHIAAEDDGMVPNLDRVPVPDGYVWLEMGSQVDRSRFPYLASMLEATIGDARVPDFRGALVVDGVRQEPEPRKVLIRVEPAYTEGC